MKYTRGLLRTYDYTSTGIDISIHKIALIDTLIPFLNNLHALTTNENQEVIQNFNSEWCGILCVTKLYIATHESRDRGFLVNAPIIINRVIQKTSLLLGLIVISVMSLRLIQITRKQARGLQNI